MGNCQFEVPRDVRSQWIEQSKNGKIVVQNLVTSEIFQFLILSKLKESQNISKLIERSIYSIPKTPKIIILNDQQGQLFLLVQESGLPLADYLQRQLLLTDILSLLERVINVIESLTRKYGPFHVRQDMIGINRNQDITVWMNELRYKNVPSYPIEKDEEAEGVMIRQIIKTFIKHSRVQTLNDLKTFKSFEDLQRNLTRMIQKKKLEMIHNSGQESGKGRIIVRALSPQTSFGSHKIGLFNNIYGKNTSSKVKHQKVVPKFIKNMKEKKSGLLDSLDHRRTMTIEQSGLFQTSQKAFKEASDSKLTSHSKSLNRFKITKMSPIKDRQLKNILKSDYSSKNLHPLNSQICDNFTSSGSSNNCMISRREFPNFSVIKSCGDLKPENLEKHNKTNSYPNSPNTTDQFRTFLPQNSESTLFESFQKVVTAINPVSGPKVSLGLYNNCVVQSKYIEEVENSEIIVQQESNCASKTLEQEFDDFFSTGSRSPRLTLGIMNESHQLAEEFGKIIDF